MDGISPVMEEEFAYMWLRKWKLFVDCEHALAAQSILAESGHVFTKMKRAERVATGGLVQWPNNTEVLKLESTKKIGDLPEILENGGRANKIDSVLSRYLLEQAFMVKCGDVFFKDPDNHDAVTILALFQNDGAEICANRSLILASLMFVRAAYGDDLHSKRIQHCSLT